MDDSSVSEGVEEACEATESLLGGVSSGAVAADEEDDDDRSAASSPIGPATVPESPPDTPAAATPPESPLPPPPETPGSPPESPPQSPAAAPPSPPAPPPRRSTPLTQETLNLTIDNDLDFEAEAPEPAEAAAESETLPTDAPTDGADTGGVVAEGEDGGVAEGEDGECADQQAGETSAGGKVTKPRVRADDEDSLEDGEISDDEDKNLRNEPKSICRFFNKGQCTWGISCRFIHPGVTDKGNYNMFAPAKPPAPPKPTEEEEEQKKKEEEEKGKNKAKGDDKEEVPRGGQRPPRQGGRLRRPVDARQVSQGRPAPAELFLRLVGPIVLVSQPVQLVLVSQPVGQQQPLVALTLRQQPLPLAPSPSESVVRRPRWPVPVPHDGRHAVGRGCRAGPPPAGRRAAQHRTRV